MFHPWSDPSRARAARAASTAANAAFDDATTVAVWEVDDCSWRSTCLLSERRWEPCRRAGRRWLAGRPARVCGVAARDQFLEQLGVKLIAAAIARSSIGCAVRDFLPSDLRRRRGVEEATRRGLQLFVMPVWIGAGLADWWCHRRSDIEHTAGTTESAIHLTMLTESSLPTLLGLFCEVNAGILGLTYGALAIHELTGILDVAYADGRRVVIPLEQYVQGFLGRVPMLATMLLTVLHWDQAQAAAGLRGRPDWRIKPKRRPLSRSYRASVLAATGAALGAVYAEELARCVRAGSAGP
jgi:hypothetical protein